MPDVLLPRVAAGQPSAVDECLARYGGLVWSLARRHTNNTSDAEDAVQEIFIDLWRSAARFNPQAASEATFVAMIARRRLIDRRRKQSSAPQAI
ncbi:MAG TPA: sigma-70 family RNA polymerase sigma factor, partial [Pirellulales bacterium]